MFITSLFDCTNNVSTSSNADDLQLTARVSRSLGESIRPSGRGSIIKHGVRDSLADYPLNPLRAPEGPGRKPSDDILPGQNYLFRKLEVSQTPVFTLLMKDRMYMSGDCIPCVLTSNIAIADCFKESLHSQILTILCFMTLPNVDESLRNR
ncbi:hypothetical protein J6590_089347 [Homalodisca vitripennis]|nr:hypothetical protein J6590_089347 [Homalodisca vitripennis]